VLNVCRVYPQDRLSSRSSLRCPAWHPFLRCPPLCFSLSRFLFNIWLESRARHPRHPTNLYLSCTMIKLTCEQIGCMSLCDTTNKYYWLFCSLGQVWFSPPLLSESALIIHILRTYFFGENMADADNYVCVTRNVCNQGFHVIPEIKGFHVIPSYVKLCQVFPDYYTNFLTTELSCFNFKIWLFEM